ncbi:MAG TPA: aminoacyl-tRNA hydrolase [Patescibacteria group bacterium]|nr:aminoacyl-tRNA hydrolase [Patescibacteria group bacterium]
MKLIVGLGNPGKNYARTRHNAGFIALDLLLKKISPDRSWELSKKFNAEIATVATKNGRVILAKPMTFMNASGQAVQLLAHYHKVNPPDIIVIHDDKDLSLGTHKIQTDRGAAGHNGVISIFTHLKTQNIVRVRLGIASESGKKIPDTADFVLKNFGLLEKRRFLTAVDSALTELQRMI